MSLKLIFSKRMYRSKLRVEKNLELERQLKDKSLSAPGRINFARLYSGS
jgi:hypothetical protein